MKNYYNILDVEPNVSFEQLKAAFRKKSLECHPDRGGSHEAMIKINEAWEVLSDPELRRQHDEQLRTGSANTAAFEEARRRSKEYERDWRKFDSWLSSISHDFNSAEFGSKTFHGVEMPTASNSISAWIFLITGGLVGLLICLVLIQAINEAWTPEQKAMKFNYITIRIGIFACVGLVAIGAWAGAWTHRKIGAFIGSWLPNTMPFSFFSTVLAGLGKNWTKFSDTRPLPKTDFVSVRCPECDQKLRVPNDSKSLTITCPKCKKRFDFPFPNSPKETTRMKLPPSNDSLAMLLKCFLISSITLVIINGIVGLLSGWNSEAMLAEAGLDTPEPGMVFIASSVTLAVFFLPLYISSIVGMFYQKNWARWLFLIGTVFMYVLNTFMGCFTWTYQSDVISSLSSIESCFDGAILSISFLSPLATEFK